MLGGMALPTKGELGQQFYNAAILLLAAIKRNELEDYKLTNPALYLFRHSVELMLKEIIGGENIGHKLDVLAARFAATLKSKTGQEVPIWFMNRLKEFAEIDPSSTAFRYSENSIRGKRVPVEGEIYVSLSYLEEIMNAMNNALVSVWNTGKSSFKEPKTSEEGTDF